MSRADRWWRPSTRRRPPVRARQRHMYTEEEMGKAFDIAYQCGQGDEAKKSQPLPEQVDDFLLIEQARLRDPDRLRQLAEAIELGGEEGKQEVERLAREWGVFPEGDNLLDVAGAAGVTPLADVDGEQLVDDLEAWLAEQGESE